MLVEKTLNNIIDLHLNNNNNNQCKLKRNLSNIN